LKPKTHPDFVSTGSAQQHPWLPSAVGCLGTLARQPCSSDHGLDDEVLGLGEEPRGREQPLAGGQGRRGNLGVRFIKPFLLVVSE